MVRHRPVFILNPIGDGNYRVTLVKKVQISDHTLVVTNFEGMHIQPNKRLQIVMRTARGYNSEGFMPFCGNEKSGWYVDYESVVMLGGRELTDTVTLNDVKGEYLKPVRFEYHDKSTSTERIDLWL
jgi:hypothetical protein